VISLWVVLLAIMATALFSAAEMAFIAADRLRLRHMAEGGHRVAARYLAAFREPEGLLSTAMLGVTIAHIVAASVATWGLIPLIGSGPAALAVTLGLTPLMLVLGEVIPKALAREWATVFMLRLLPIVEATGTVLRPLARGANGLVGRVLALVGLYRTNTRQFVSREELKLLLQLEPEEADVTTTEAEMIDKIFDLGETTVREVMLPLVDVATLPDDAAVEDAVQLVQDRGFSRIPIHRERVDNVVGIVTAMDLLARGADCAGVRDLMRPATYVPETKRIDDLLREMQRARVQLAVVVDEYGGAVGIVTLEDIVEQVVGEIRDEHDRAPDTAERLADGSYRVAGRATVGELNEALGWSLPTGDFETVAGLVLTTARRIPAVGEVLTISRHTVTILEADRRRVLTVRIAPPDRPH
jgi:CBS domain containing-hemolysin-like protein